MSALALLLGAACAGERRPEVRREQLPGGIEHVLNAAANPDTGRTQWIWTEDLRLSIADSVAGALLRPAAAMRTRSGYIVVTDVAPWSIKVYDVSGRFQRELGREGGGPGEYRYVQLGVHEDTVIAFDPSQRRLTWFGLDGSVLRIATASSS